MGNGPENIKIIKNFMDLKDLQAVDTYMRSINVNKDKNIFINVLDEIYNIPPNIKAILLKYTEKAKHISEAEYGRSLDSSDLFAIRIATVGIEYLPHVDKVGIVQEVGAEVQDWKDSWSGHLAIMFYVNDDYDGGELYFPDHGIRYKPEKNSLAMFPGNKNFIHGVSQVKNSDRFTLIKWSKILD
jgi:predicted 2-oxoglutarate/Fe(II)-dependent dioxygenase YbiX